MSEVLELSDADFAQQMRGLVHEAEKALTDKPTSAAAQPTVSPEAAPAAEPAAEPPQRVSVLSASQTIPEMLRPMVQGVQAIGRATGEHTQILGKLEKAAGDAAEAQRVLPQIVADLKGIVEQRNHVSRQMFDALHEELKTYKDGFLLDSVHRPMIRDLITLHDDLSQIHLQMQEAVAVHPAPSPGESDGLALGFLQRLQSIEVHLEHNLEFILEVLARLEVSPLPPGTGKLDKHTQRAVAVEMAEEPAHDLEVIRSVKRGFLWKDRVVRAEEVVVKKWKEGFLVALPPPAP